MNCSLYRQSVQDLVDGSIGPIRRAELERHLETCEACRALAADLQTIHDTAGALEPLPVADRVWLQIAGRLHQQGRVAAPQRAARPLSRARHVGLLAIAATLMLAVAGSIFVLFPEFRANNQPASQAAPDALGVGADAAGAEDVVKSIESEFRLAEEHYQNAIAKLEGAARVDPASPEAAAIDPQTAAMLQKNLQVIDQAIAESRVALRTEPQSVPARDSLFDGLKRKVGLLQDTIALMNEMRKGNSAGAAQIVDGLNKS